jgi:hypothetical protein
MLFILSAIYFVGLVVTSVATGFLTTMPHGFLMMGLGTVLYAMGLGINSAFSK